MPRRIRRPILTSALSTVIAAGALFAAFLALTLGASPAYANDGLVRITSQFGQTILVPREVAAAQARAAEPRRTVAARTSRVRPQGISNPALNRQIVPYTGSEAPGTVVVNTGTKFLYLVLADGQAMRYGIGVARSGFEWSGTHSITAKREWPDWRPPAQMLARQPDLPTFMPGGPDNPLGARALYIGSTLYRIHGTSEPWTIGTNVSSGCIRLTNDDVIDLYGRVAVGARVVVI